MRVRSPGVPDEASDHALLPAPSVEKDEGDDYDDYDEADREPEPVRRHPDGSVRFRVPTRVLVGKFAAAGVVACVGLLASNRPETAVGLLAAVCLAIYALRDVLARERLRADAVGLVTVRGFATRHRLEWADVERVRVDTRSRFGASSELLEIDAGEHIYLYSRFDLGVDPRQAADALESVRDDLT